MKYKSIFWDFDGVWSKDRFYKSFETDYPDIYNFIQTKVFGSNGDGRVNKWMRSELSHNDINEFISKQTGFNLDILTKKFLEDVAKMDIEIRHVPIVEKLKKQRNKSWYDNQ